MAQARRIESRRRLADFIRAFNDSELTNGQLEHYVWTGKFGGGTSATESGAGSDLPPEAAVVLKQTGWL